MLIALSLVLGFSASAADPAFSASPALLFSASPAFSAPPDSPGPCDLLDKATVSALLGKPVASVQPEAPAPDEDSGGMRSVCVYLAAGNSMLVVLIEEFKSAQAANDVTTKEVVAERTGDDDVTVEEASGLGGKAFWVYSASAANYTAVKGDKVLSISLGGTGKEPQSYKESLRPAFAAALKKL